MSDEKQTGAPSLAAGDPVHAAPGRGVESLVSAPIDWGEPVPVSPEQQAQRKAEWEELKERVRDADPGSLTRAEKFARTVARKDATKAGQDKVGGADEQAPAVAKPPRKRAAKVAAAADQGQPGAAKTTRTRKKTAQPAAVPAQAQPSSPTTRAADEGIPPITAEAITFLGNPNATAADVLKLGPESLAFVQHHFSRMEQLEADSELTSAWLLARATRPVSPAYQKFADALVKHGRSKSALAKGEPEAAAPPAPAEQASAKAPSGSYVPKATALAAYAPVAVRFGKLEIVAAKAGPQEQTPEAMSEDTKRAHKVIGTAHILASAPINDLTPEEAAELVTADIEEVRAIKDEKARQLALNAVAESILAQPRYKAEFERQAPDLVPAAVEANQAMDADWDKASSIGEGLSWVAEVDTPFTREEAATLAKNDIEAIRDIKNDELRQQALSHSLQIGGYQPLYKEEFTRQAPDLVEPARAAYEAVKAKEAQQIKERQEPENSIERSPVQLVSNEQKPAQSAAAAEKVPSSATPRPSLRKRLMLVVGGAAQKAGTWLSDRGREGQAKPAAQEVPGKPVSLAKPADATKPAVPAPANDKSAIVPEAVARRFLKVEQEYYFPDRTPAFSDRGQKLATRGAHPEVVRTLVEIAKARGWDTITVKGTDDFRRSAWMEAAQNGLKVVGYQPTALDLAELANRPANNTVEKGVVKEKGAAPAKQQAAAQAAEASPAEPTVALQGEAALAAEASKRDPELAKKAKAFAENKPSFVVKKYPDLAGAYGVVEAAKAFAAEKLPEAAREEFVGLARRHVMQKIITGEPVKGPKVYLAPVKAREAGEQAKATVQEAADLGKSPRAKEVARER